MSRDRAEAAVPDGVSGGRRGFTLVEAIVALALSTVLVLLVWSVFLAQNELYEDVVRRSEVHDHVRSAVDLVASEVRPTPEGGFVLAESDQLVLYQPLSMGFICEVQGTSVSTYLPRADAGLDTARVTGYGVRNADDGSWSFVTGVDWDALANGVGSSYAEDCEDVGFDIADLDENHFHRLRGPGTSSAAPEAGDAFILIRELELRFADSSLDPDHTALYRGTYGETLVEFATGLASDSHFEYRLQGETTFSSQVTGGDLALIDAVRVTARGIDNEEGTGLDPYEFTLSRDIPIRNETDES